MKKLLVVGLNPTWQKTLIFSEFKLDKVNRAKSIDLVASGKGINFAQAANIWGAEPNVYQFLGGTSGQNIIKNLSQRKIKAVSVIVDEPTRTCTTCLCKKSAVMTEIIEPNNYINTIKSQELLDKICNDISKYDGIAICGSSPDGISNDFLATIATCAKKYDVPLLLDACNNIEKTLASGGVTILKINKDELFHLTNKKSIEQGIYYIYDKCPIKNIIITDKGNNAFLYDGKVIIQEKPPMIKIVNPLGAGDTVSGVILAEFVKEYDIQKAFTYGIKAGSKSCENSKISFYKKENI